MQYVIIINKNELKNKEELIRNDETSNVNNLLRRGMITHSEPLAHEHRRMELQNKVKPGNILANLIRYSSLVSIHQMIKYSGTQICIALPPVSETGLHELLPLQLTILKWVLTKSRWLKKGNHLEGVFPNPFSLSTTLEWTLTEPCEVRIQIHDLTGKPVAVPVNKRQQAGEYTISFDASGFEAGIYFCQFTAGGDNETQKLLVLKRDSPQN